MKKVIDDPRLMIRVCDLYYNKEASLQEIGSELGLSRPTINRLLASAKAAGIVRISIPALDSIRYWETEQKLASAWGLKEAVITDFHEDRGTLMRELGRAAAGYLRHTIRDGDVVGLSMGTTLLRTAEQIGAPHAANTVFVPLIGGMGRLRMELHANHITQQLAEAYGGSFYPLHAPARISSPSVREELRREDSIASAFQMMKRLRMAVVGIGTPGEQSVIRETGLFSQAEIDSLTAREAVGEICLQFYDRNGNTQPYRENSQVIGITLDHLRRVPFTVGVAGGPDKLEAIRGALRGGFLDVLITDIRCAQALTCEQTD